MASPAVPYAQAIGDSLERVGELSADPTPLVYARLFAVHPAMQAHFWRDTDGAIRGEMLSRAFDAILDFVGERRYAHHMIGAEPGPPRSRRRGASSWSTSTITSA